MIKNNRQAKQQAKCYYISIAEFHKEDAFQTKSDGWGDLRKAACLQGSVAQEAAPGRRLMHQPCHAVPSIQC